MNNKQQDKDTKGRFSKKIEPETVLVTDENYVKQVQQELYDGYQDIERIRKAYQLITGINEPANYWTMRRTILAN